jgi:putative nucleotidyltransferase with HDIG domain
MTVPGRLEAVSLLCSLDPPDWLLRHSRAVGEVAGFLAARVAGRGLPVDQRLAESAALLHDVDKALPRDDPRRSLGHGHAGARWLVDQGHAELAGPVSTHPVTHLLDGAWFETWLSSAPAADRIVAYADKRASQRLVSLDARFASWSRRYPDTWEDTTVAAVRAAAERLEADVCGMAGLAPADVRRLPWTAPAIAAAIRAS